MNDMWFSALNIMVVLGSDDTIQTIYPECLLLLHKMTVIGVTVKTRNSAHDQSILGDFLIILGVKVWYIQTTGRTTSLNLNGLVMC